MKQYLLFDLDGTLTDPMVGITSSVQYALEKFWDSCTVSERADSVYWTAACRIISEILWVFERGCGEGNTILQRILYAEGNI